MKPFKNYDFSYLRIAGSVFLLAKLLLSMPFVYAQGGYTLDFDGVDDLISIPHHSSIEPTSAMTAEAWFYPEDISGQTVPPVLRKANGSSGYTIEIDNATNQLRFFVHITGTGFVASPAYSIPSLDKWYHAAGTYDGANISLYVDGVLIGSTAASGVITASSEPLMIGSEPTFGNRFFDGKIDEVRIWDDARTQAEIQANMHRELEGSEANLVAYYRMSDGSGTSLTDNSTNANTGTLTNGPVWKTSGALAGPGQALDFDGSNDYVNVSLAVTPTGTFTIESWISFSSLGGQENFFTLHQGVGGFRVIGYKTSSNEIYLYTYDGSVYNLASGFTISQTNEWHHLAFVYNGGNVNIYANGNLVKTATGQGSFTISATNNFYVGADLTAPGYYSDVKFDEVRVWDDVRTEAEIREYKDRTLEGSEANLVAYYRFDQQAASGHTTVYDYSGNSNDGTLTNMDATTDWVSGSPFNTWIGSEDSDWNNVDNWSRGSVPSTEDVGVFAWSGSNAPASSNISGRNCYVASGASISHSGNLTLNGDFYNEGTFSTTGTVTFSGSAAQKLSGSGSTTIGTLTLNNASGLTMEQDATISTSLTLTNGVLTLNSQTLSLSNSTGISGTPGAGNHVDATSGILRKNFAGTGSFNFPVGDGTNYTPISLNFSSGSFASAYTDVGLTVGKHPQNSSTTDYLNRYWTVTSSGITSFDCVVTATYADGDIAGTEGSIEGGKWDGSAWYSLGAVNAGANQLSGTVTSFSDFSGGEPSIFPVEWLSFTASTHTSFVLLEWKTAIEENTDYFGVERSTDNYTWAEIGRVEAGENSTTSLDYSFADVHAQNGKIYYRLRQVDIDGAFSYSKVLDIDRKTQLRIYPNPVSEILNLSLPAGQWKAELLDSQGRQIAVYEKVTKQIDMSEMPAGNYVLRLMGAQGEIQNFAVIKK